MDRVWFSFLRPVVFLVFVCGPLIASGKSEPVDLSNDVVQVSAELGDPERNATEALNEFRAVSDQALLGLPFAYVIPFPTAGLVTMISFELPAGARFVELSARDNEYGEQQRIECTQSGTQVECPFDGSPFFQEPMTMGVIHETSGTQIVSMTMVSDSGATEPQSVSVEVSEDSGRTAVVDVLVLYSESMPRIFPGNALRSQVETWFSVTNRILADSGVLIRLRQVGLERFDYPEEASVFQARSDVGDSVKGRALRDKYHADVAIYYRPMPNPTIPKPCGVAPLGLAQSYLGDSGWLFVVVHHPFLCIGVGTSIFAHELGHALGLGHNIEVPKGNSPRGYWEFSRGAIINQNEFNGTIMAANATNRFSNPAIICPSGVPCGVDATDPDFGADAALSLNSTRFLAEQARQADVLSSDDLGISLRKLNMDTTIGLMTVRADVNNYAKQQINSIEFNLLIPSGLELQSVKGPATCNGPANGHLDCVIDGISGMDAVAVDFDFNLGVGNQSLGAHLTNEQSLAFNNDSVLDVGFDVEVLLNSISIEPDFGSFGDILFFELGIFRDIQLPAEVKVSVTLPTVPVPLMSTHNFTVKGFDINTGSVSEESFFCTTNNNRIECPTILMRPANDPEFQIPANQSEGASLALILAGDTDPDQVVVEVEVISDSDLTPYNNQLPNSAPGTFAVGPEMNGSWFDPSHDGEGFVIEILEGGTAVVYWFTYDKQGKQAWFAGAGAWADNQIIIKDAVIAHGGLFGPGFDPAEVVRETWGDITITFEDCNNARVNYAGAPGFGSGAQQLTRLTALAGGGCQDNTGNENTGGLSGSWFDPSHDGEGLVIEQLSSTLGVVYWFSYTPQGEQAWFVGLADINGRTLTVSEATRGEGGRFGIGFDPTLVSRPHWGTFSVEFTDCNNAAMSYSSDEFGFGDQEMTRLTARAGHACLSLQ